MKQQILFGVGCLVYVSLSTGCSKSINVNQDRDKNDGGAASEPDESEAGTAGKSSGTAGSEANPNGGADDGSGTAGGGTGGNGTGSGNDSGGGTGGTASNDGALCSNCACVAQVKSRYLVRTDGAALLVSANGKTQTPILNDEGKPLAPIMDIAGADHGYGCAALKDGTAWCWAESATGINADGELGNGNKTKPAAVYNAAPVLVEAGKPLASVKSVSTGSIDACAVKTDGTLWCWGDITWLVGNGASRASEYAVQITTDGSHPLENVLSVALSQSYAGYSQACALIKGEPANEVWCWGAGGSYGLGDGGTTNRQYPSADFKAVLSAPTAVGLIQPSNDAGNGCAIDGDHVRCWGYNYQGTTGGGATQGTRVTNPEIVVRGDDSPLPAPLALVNNRESMWCALESDNKVWCWGRVHATATRSAADFGVTNVIALGEIEPALGSPRYLTSDGQYHVGPNLSVEPKCGAL